MLATSNVTVHKFQSRGQKTSFCMTNLAKLSIVLRGSSMKRLFGRRFVPVLCLGSGYLSDQLPSASSANDAELDIKISR